MCQLAPKAQGSPWALDKGRPYRKIERVPDDSHRGSGLGYGAEKNDFPEGGRSYGSREYA